MTPELFPASEAVDYSKFRDEIRTGDLLLCSGTSMMSKIIQHMTGSVWSHVGVILRADPITRIIVMESVETIGVRAIALSKYLTDYNGSGAGYPGGVVIARHSGAEKLDKTAAVLFGQTAVELLGHRYDNAEIIKIVARIFKSVLPFTKDERIDLVPNREYICAEYALKCLNAWGLDVTHNRRGFIAPFDFPNDPKVDVVAVLKRPENVSTEN